MALYMLFAAAGILIYSGTVLIGAVSGVNDVHRSPAVIVPAEPTRSLAAGLALVQELGCIEPNGESR